MSKFKELLPSICPLCQLQHFPPIFKLPSVTENLAKLCTFFLGGGCPSHLLSLITVTFSFQESHLNIGVETVCRESNGFLQYSCLENPMGGGAWQAVVHGVAKGRTRLSNFTFTFPPHALEKEMATHSSVLAWRIPGTGEPGGLPSMGSHRAGHN